MNKPFALIVEDDRDIVALFRHVLDLAGYRTEIALHGKVAAEYLAQSTPDIVLLDLNSPDFEIPGTFSLPNEARQVGSAYIVSQLDPLIPLKGEVSFQRIGRTGPIEGRFSLTSERGETFAGKFIAEWGEQMAICG